MIMSRSNLIDLGNYRIVDLSEEIRPGLLKVNGEYVHGSELRRLEIRQWIYGPDKTFMHWVETETHIGTHVEFPSHYKEELKDGVSLPLETFIGEAIGVNLGYKKPGEPLMPEDLEEAGVKRDDILILWSPYSGDDRPKISPEAAKWMFECGIKMLGVDTSIGVEWNAELMATHDYLLGNDIPIIERLAHLDQLRKKRFFFIGLPLRIRLLDSCWIRAVALEEK